MEPPRAASAKRAVCARCQRPLRACYCAALPPQALYTRRTRVVVLQHAREQRQRQAISSVPVLAQVLAVPTSALVIPLAMEAGAGGESLTDTLCAALREQLDRIVLGDAVERVFVLFPHADARTLTTEFAVGDTNIRQEYGKKKDEEDDEKAVVLVVVDGTWHEAKKIVHHSRAYWERVALGRRARGKVFEYVCLDSTAHGDDSDRILESSPQWSIYGELRKEPMEGCVSTLEAVALALRVLEPEPDAHNVHKALLRAFRAMVAIQSQFQQQGKAAQRERHGGTPKPTGAHATRLKEDKQTETVDQQRESRGAVKRYVFFTTQTDFRKRQRLVMEGAAFECTRDEAVARCTERNRSRTRGNRVSTLPEDAFQRQQLQHHEREEHQHHEEGGR